MRQPGRASARIRLLAQRYLRIRAPAVYIKICAPAVYIRIRAPAVDGYDYSLKALYSQEWFGGVFVWLWQVHEDPCSCCLRKDPCSCWLHKDLWQADPTHGGASDDDFR